ncbi:MAG: 2-hydroxyacid dehydrogenase [Bacteroidales bacterium]
MKVAIFSTLPHDREYLDAANRNGRHELVYFEHSLKKETAPIARGFDGVCAFVNDRIDRACIEILHSLHIKVIALRCAGFNQVDLQAAHDYGIPVLRVPAYSPHAIAEHAVALILTLNRKTHKAYNRVREGNFSAVRLTGFDLYGKTAGVIGTGKIGSAFARIMMGFGCRVLAYDRHPSKTLEEQGIVYTGLDELYAESDIISLHCPLTPETYKMINETSIAKMKEGVMLINTSRGKLVSTSSVIRGLRERKIGYLGIDVYAQEENLFFRDLSEILIEDEAINTLMTFPNVLVTAHQAFMTREALEEIARTTLHNLDDLDAGRQLVNEVKLDVLQGKK